MKKKDMVFPTLESLRYVEEVLNELTIALNDKTRTIETSDIPDALKNAVLLGTTAIASLGAMGLLLYFSGSVVGLSAVGITSGLAAIGGNMLGGIATIAATPVLIVGAGAALIAYKNNKKLYQKKEEYYYDALNKQTELIEEFENTDSKDADRIEYLEGLKILLRATISALKHDLDLKINLLADMGDDIEIDTEF